MCMRVLSNSSAGDGVHRDGGVVKQPELGVAGLRIPLGIWGVGGRQPAHTLTCPAPATAGCDVKNRDNLHFLSLVNIEDGDDHHCLLRVEGPVGHGGEPEDAGQPQHAHQRGQQVVGPASGGGRGPGDEMVMIQVLVI